LALHCPCHPGEVGIIEIGGVIVAGIDEETAGVAEEVVGDHRILSNNCHSQERSRLTILSKPRWKKCPFRIEPERSLKKKDLST
jgi:hypothetical protein